MKALSVKQPYAFLIGGGEKTIELRSWRTDYRGDLLICSSKSEKDAWVIYNKRHNQLPAGVMMCVAELVDVRLLEDTDVNREAAFADEIEEGAYGWFLENIRHVKLKPVQGKLRLFEVDDELIEYVDDEKYDFFEDAQKFAIPSVKFSPEHSIWSNWDE